MCQLRQTMGKPKAILPSPPSTTKLLPPPLPALLIGYVKKRKLQLGFCSVIAHFLPQQTGLLCLSKKGSDWLKRWLKAQHNIFKL